MFRLRRDRWLRIPWSEIRGGTWVHTGRRNGPALLITGDRDERPNLTWYAMPCRPSLPGGWEAGARVLQAEFERRGISWRTYFDDRRLAEGWTSTRWAW